MTPPEQTTQEKYYKNLTDLLNAGMPLEKIQEKMERFKDYDLNHQATLLKDMKTLWIGTLWQGKNPYL